MNKKVNMIMKPLTLVIILIMAVNASFSPSNTYVNPFESMSQPENGVDLSSGQASWSQNLYTIEGVNGLSLNIRLNYSSHIMFNVTSNNDIAPTSWVGLGWNLH